jgi:hypothetical protein
MSETLVSERGGGGVSSAFSSQLGGMYMYLFSQRKWIPGARLKKASAANIFTVSV